MFSAIIHEESIRPRALRKDGEIVDLDEELIKRGFLMVLCVVKKE
jgi:hypothetical protein